MTPIIPVIKTPYRFQLYLSNISLNAITKFFEMPLMLLILYCIDIILTCYRMNCVIETKSIFKKFGFLTIMNLGIFVL